VAVAVAVAVVVVVGGGTGLDNAGPLRPGAAAFLPQVPPTRSAVRGPTPTAPATPAASATLPASLISSSRPSAPVRSTSSRGWRVNLLDAHGHASATARDTESVESCHDVGSRAAGSFVEIGRQVA
jgi:hypothetical protein